MWLIAFVLACGAPAELEKPNPPPVWPNSNAADLPHPRPSDKPAEPSAPPAAPAPATPEPATPPEAPAEVAPEPAVEPVPTEAPQ
jgi:hypothetical protein